MRLRCAILFLFCCLWQSPAHAQACAMCYSNATATGKDGRTAISKGVLVLLAPPLSTMTVGVWLALRYGQKRDLEQNAESERSEPSLKS